MIIIEDMVTAPTYKCFAYNALFRALSSVQYPVFVWDRTTKNIFDVYDELKPDMILYHSDIRKTLDKVDVQPIHFQEWHESHPYIVDSVVYTSLPPNQELLADTICIAPFSDVDVFNEKFYTYMDKKTPFRYFGVTPFGGHKDCGQIPLTMHSLLLSSAKQVLCLSYEFALNAYLSNKNIIGYEIQDSIIDNIKSTNLIKEWI